jgi:hypothetical protein
MNLLPTDSYLGNLKIVEVYDYFDVPCLFTCINNSGQQFLAIWIDEMEDSNLWLYLPVSSHRIKLLKNREIDLRHAFLTAEDNYVFKVKVYKSEPEVSITHIISSEINENDLPEPEEYLQSNEIPVQQISFL